MILAWQLFFGALLIGLGCFGLALILGEGWDDFSLIVAGIAGLAALIFLLAGTIISLERHYGRISCRTFAAQTARKTKFAIYTRWDGGDCLTPDGSGHWIPTKNLREFGSKP